MSMHDERAKSVLMHLVASFIAREAGRETLITPTNIDLSPDGKNATLFVTVLPDSQTSFALDFLNRNRDDLKEHLKKGSRLAHIPRIIFKLDEGEKYRQRLDDVSREIHKND